jgi:hypothetical protein
MIVKRTHKILQGNFSGINANNKTVNVVKTVIECPEGKLACPTAFFPMITKQLLSNTTAGLGTRNIFFKPTENIREASDADINDSHIFGAYKMKILKTDKIMEASPNWVIL